MTVNLGDWNEILWEAADSKEGFICVHQTLADKFNRNPGRVVFFSSEEYRKLGSSYKLSINQIITVTEDLLKKGDPTKASQKYASKIKETDKNSFAETTRGKACDAEFLQNTVDALKNVYQKKVERYQAKKEAGLWGKIQWLVFTIFFDRSSQIENLRKPIPTPERIFTLTERILQKRISVDIEQFEEKAPVPKEERVKLSEITPAIIKKSWLTKFAQDKFDYDHTISKEGRSLRTEIIELTDYLAELKKIKEEWETEDLSEQENANEEIPQQEKAAEQEMAEEQEKVSDIDVD